MFPTLEVMKIKTPKTITFVIKMQVWLGLKEKKDKP